MGTAVYKGGPTITETGTGPNAPLSGQGAGDRHLSIRNRKRLLFLAGDVLAVLLANLLAVALRWDFDWSSIALKRHHNIELVLLDVLLTPLAFQLSGLYHGYWKYTSLDDLWRLVRAVAYRTTGLIVLLYTFSLYGVSRAVVIISTVLLLMFTGLLRLAPRFHFEFVSTRKRTPGHRALIIGAGDTGESLVREL